MTEKAIHCSVCYNHGAFIELKIAHPKNLKKLEITVNLYSHCFEAFLLIPNIRGFRG